MKHMLALAAITSSALLFAGTAGAAPGDKALGGGKTTTDIFNVSAHSGPLGGDASGHMHARNVPANEGMPFFDFEFRGDVTCLRVVGNLAVMGGRTTELFALGFPIFNPQTFPGFLFYVEDNQALGIPDEISFQIPTVAVPLTCPVPDPVNPQFPLTNGNINVFDN